MGNTSGLLYSTLRLYCVRVGADVARRLEAVVCIELYARSRAPFPPDLRLFARVSGSRSRRRAAAPVAHSATTESTLLFKFTAAHTRTLYGL